MHRYVLAIRDVVRSEIGGGKTVDVDACCAKFAALYPELSQKQIKDTILEVVAAYGGGAVWGMETLSRPKGGQSQSGAA